MQLHFLKKWSDCDRKRNNKQVTVIIYKYLFFGIRYHYIYSPDNNINKKHFFQH